MENIPSKVVDSINLGRQISEGARKLERVIVLRPAGTTNDIIGIVSYAKQHGDLKGYDVNRIEQVMEKERKANRVLSDAFKRITLFEAASYIEGTFASELGDDDVAREKVPEILRAQISLMDRSDYSEAYETITQAYRTLLGQRGSHLKVSGKVNGTYLFNLMQVLGLCSPDRHQTRMNTGFAGRGIRFSTYDNGGYTVYQKEVDSNQDFADFSKKCPHLFNPAIGRILLESPETVDYAGQFLDEAFRQYQIVDPTEVGFSNGRSLEEEFRIEDFHA